eukprot:jgi/Chlat1/4460/Chrsp29S04566
MLPRKHEKFIVNTFLQAQLLCREDQRARHQNTGKAEAEAHAAALGASIMAVPAHALAVLVVLAAVAFTSTATAAAAAAPAPFWGAHGDVSFIETSFIPEMSAACQCYRMELLGAVDPLKASISGYLFCDRCNNRFNDTGDYPLAGVTVTAGYFCARPAFCHSDTEYTTSTDVDGYYGFKNVIDTYESFERDTGSAGGDYFCSVSLEDRGGGGLTVPPPCDVYTLSSRLTDLTTSSRTLAMSSQPDAPALAKGLALAPANSSLGHKSKNARSGSSINRQPLVVHMHATRLSSTPFQLVRTYSQTTPRSPSSCTQYRTGWDPSRPGSKVSQSPEVTDSMPMQHASEVGSDEYVSTDSMYWAELVNVTDTWSRFTTTWRFLSAPSNATERIPTSQIRVLFDNVVLPWGAYRLDSFAVDYTADQAFVLVCNDIPSYHPANEGDVVIYVTGQSLGGTQPVIYKAVKGPNMRPGTRATITSLQIDTSAKPTPMLYWIETRKLIKSSNGSRTEYLNTVIRRGALSHNRIEHLKDVQVLFKRTMACGGPYDFEGMPVTQLQVDPVNRRLYALHNAYYAIYRTNKKNSASYLGVYDIGSASSKQPTSRTLLRPLGVFVFHCRIDVYSDPPIMYALSGGPSNAMYKLQLKRLDRCVNRGTMAVPPYQVAPHAFAYVDNIHISYDPACLNLNALQQASRAMRGCSKTSSFK